MTVHDDRRFTAALVAAALCGVIAACSGGGGNGGGGGGGGTGGGGTGGGTGGSTPSTVTSLAMNPASVTGGAGSQGTVTVSPAPTVGTPVNLTSDNAAATVPGSVTVNSGATSANFAVATSAVPSQTSVTIRASLNSTTQPATLTLMPPPVVPFAAVVRVVSLSQAKRKQGNTTVDVAGKPAGTLNSCPLVNDGSGQRLDCEIDASASTSPNGFRNFRYKWRLGNVDGDSGTVTANKNRPAVQNCGFFGGQDNNNQFLNMRVTVDITSNSGATVTGTVEGVNVFPAGLCGYAF